MNNPTLITQPFASNGDKYDIPNTTTISGKFSQSMGFPEETSKPIINGGTPPTREDFNGAFYLLSSIVFYQQKGFIFQYDANQDYYTPALISDNGVIYFCLADMVAGTVRPSEDEDNTYWKKFADIVLGNTDFGDRLTAVEEVIPNEATSINKLADRAFVNSTIQTNTANFRGNWTNWTNVPSDARLYPADYSGNKTPTTNDYMVVQDASDYTEDELTGTWRFKYSGVWATAGKNGWQPEYQVNETPLTADQIAALNSGITQQKVAEIGVIPVATSTVLGGVKEGTGVTIGADGTINIDTTNLINQIDWTQLNTSEKLHNNGASGVINLANGRAFITSATEVTMPLPPLNCQTWVTLWCMSGQVDFVGSVPVYYESGEQPILGTNEVAVYTLAGIGNGCWYCLFAGKFGSN